MKFKDPFEDIVNMKLYKNKNKNKCTLSIAWKNYSVGSQNLLVNMFTGLKRTVIEAKNWKILQYIP